MNPLYNTMLAAYPQTTPNERHNAQIEVAQQIVLAGLARIISLTVVTTTTKGYMLSIPSVLLSS